MPKIRPRIIGTEMEWGLQLQLVGSDQLQNFRDDKQVDLLTSGDALPKGLITIPPNLMLSNGGRYYRDINTQLEYATPEDISFASVLISELASERIAIHSLLYFLQTNGNTTRTQLHRRIVSDNKFTWGYHVNLATDRRLIPTVDDAHLHQLGLHMASSSAFFGTGVVLEGKEGEPAYNQSQKFITLQTDFGKNTTREKCLINTRDEPLADSEEYLRIHVASLDPNISEWATIVKLGSCSLVLRMIEQGIGRGFEIFDDGSETRLARFAKQSAADPTMRSATAMVRGRNYSQLDIQRELVELVGKTEHTDEEAAVLSEWIRAVEDWEKDPELLADRSDAVLKRQLIQKKISKSGANTPGDRLEVARQVDKAYGMIAEITQKDVEDSVSTEDLYKRGLPAKIRTKIHYGTHTDEDVQTRITDPPLGTRAQERARIIRRADLSREGWTFNWAYYQNPFSRVGDPVRLPNPYGNNIHFSDQ